MQPQSVQASAPNSPSALGYYGALVVTRLSIYPPQQQLRDENVGCSYNA